MTKTDSLRGRLSRGDVLLGLANTYPAAGILEGMGRGWDLLWIDGQHGQFGYTEAIHAVRTAASLGIASLLRVPTHEPGLLGVYADMAPDAIMVPMVCNRTEAEAIVSALRYPPHGQRSFGGRRPVDVYGKGALAESDLLIVAQIETPEAVANAGQIAAVDGIDMLFFGPDDMKLRMGVPMGTSQLAHDELRRMVIETAAAARSANKFSAMPGVSADNASALAELGYQLLIGGSDIGFLRAASAKTLDDFRTALPKEN